VVTAGIHWDNISEDGIMEIVSNSKILVDLILKEVSKGIL